MKASLRFISSKRCGKEILCDAVQNETVVPTTTPAPNVTAVSSSNNFQAKEFQDFKLFSKNYIFKMLPIILHIQPVALTCFDTLEQSVCLQEILEVAFAIVVPVVSALVGVCILAICFKCCDILRARKRKAKENCEEWHLCPKLPSCRLGIPSAGCCGLGKLADCFRRRSAINSTGKSKKTEVSCIAV
jgi:hypothetical protein